MKTLYLDTSSSYLFAGISENKNLLGEIKLKLDKELSIFTLPEIEKLFSSCHLEPKTIDKILVVNGPGSFTGIRIGVTIAKIYAWSLKKEITTISSLEAMACSVESEVDYIVPMIDARRDYVYGMIMTKDQSVVLKAQYIKRSTLEAAMDHLPGKVLIITNDNIKTDKEKVAYQPNIAKIIALYEEKETINPHAVEPEYLKKTEAEENRVC